MLLVIKIKLENLVYDGLKHEFRIPNPYLHAILTLKPVQSMCTSRNVLLLKELLFFRSLVLSVLFIIQHL